MQQAFTIQPEIIEGCHHGNCISVRVSLERGGETHLGWGGTRDGMGGHEMG